MQRNAETSDVSFATPRRAMWAVLEVSPSNLIYLTSFSIQTNPLSLSLTDYLHPERLHHDLRQRPLQDTLAHVRPSCAPFR